ncbi:MAG: hypothetical protein ABEI52_07155 [Halobacteriaceae archaeon]
MNDLSAWTVVSAGIVLIGGYLTHELMHVLPLKVTGANYEIEFAPGDKPLWYNLTVGRVFEFRTETTPVVGIMSLLAPGLLAIPGIVMWAHILRSDYTSASLVVIVATWIVVFLPSLADWAEAWSQLQLLRSD